MRFSYIVTFRHENDPTARLSSADLEAIRTVVLSTPGLRLAHLFTPESARDYYTDDGPSPLFMMQLKFNELPELEAAVAANGHLQQLADASALPSLAGTHVTQQVMVTRPFPVIDARADVAADTLPCSYLVHYPGQAADLNAWHSYYLSHHPQIMKDFPGIREIEIFSRVDWCDAMPWERVAYMQRNKLVFDSAACLTDALQSDVRHRMRADFEQFPPFTGSNAHFAMATHTVAPGRE